MSSYYEDNGSKKNYNSLLDYKRWITSVKIGNCASKYLSYSELQLNNIVDVIALS